MALRDIHGWVKAQTDTSGPIASAATVDSYGTFKRETTELIDLLLSLVRAYKVCATEHGKYP